MNSGSCVRSDGHLPPGLRTQTRYLLTGILQCAVCGANFIVRAFSNTRFGRYRYYGCAYHARRGKAVCPNGTLLPQEAIERELLRAGFTEVLVTGPREWPQHAALLCRRPDAPTAERRRGPRSAHRKPPVSAQTIRLGSSDWAGATATRVGAS